MSDQDINGKTVAVLTGDLVGSTELSVEQRKAVLDFIPEVPSRFNKVFPCVLHEQAEVDRGDRWQMLAIEYNYSARVAVYIRTYLKGHFGIDTRVSIGRGPVEYLAPESLGRSSGPAFEVSGRRLEEMKKSERMVIHAYRPVAEDDILGAEPFTFRLLDRRITEATQAQSRVLCEILLKRKQIDIADELEVVQSTVSEHLDAAHWVDIKDILTFIELSAKKPI